MARPSSAVRDSVPCERHQRGDDASAEVETEKVCRAQYPERKVNGLAIALRFDLKSFVLTPRLQER